MDVNDNLTTELHVYDKRNDVIFFLSSIPLTCESIYHHHRLMEIMSLNLFLMQKYALHTINFLNDKNY